MVEAVLTTHAQKSHNNRMNLGLRELASFMARHKEDQSLVLATVSAVEGSSYRKPGAMMMIDKNHNFAGLISGGCLESDLVEHASTVFKDGQARKITYDLSTDDEAIWGLGLGCGGTIHLLLQKVELDEGCAFFSDLFEFLEQGLGCVLAIVCQEMNGIPAGSWALRSVTGEVSGEPQLFDMLEGRLEFWDGVGRYQYAGEEQSVLLVKIDPSPIILLCGAGPDAIPMAKQVDALGWGCVVVDHRSAYARSERFPDTCNVIQLKPDQLRNYAKLDQVSAAIVMSHNLVHDATYLKQLVEFDLPYLGLLGPSARRDEMQKDLGISEGVIRGPVGFDIGAELPESVALSVMAEIHAVLSGK